MAGLPTWHMWGRPPEPHCCGNCVPLRLFGPSHTQPSCTYLLHAIPCLAPAHYRRQGKVYTGGPSPSWQQVGDRDPASILCNAAALICS